MHNYKLKKVYPGLPNDWEVGMLLGKGDYGNTFKPVDAKYTDYIGYTENSLDMFHEFWERVDRPEILITQFRRKDNGLISSLHSNGKYSFILTDSYDGTGTAESSFYLALPKVFEIYEVEVKGKTFKLDDIFRVNNTHVNQIVNFSQRSDGSIWVLSKYPNTNQTIAINYKVQGLIWMEQPVLITTDDKLLYETDKVWFVTGAKFEVKSYDLTNKSMVISSLKDRPTFSEESIARLYANNKKNKKQFSIQDIIDVYAAHKTWKPGGDDQIIEKLLKLKNK